MDTFTHARSAFDLQRTATQARPEATSARRTGRTKRMIEQAIHLEQQGHAVYIVAISEAHCVSIRRCLPIGTTIKVETDHHMGNVDWLNMRLRFAHPNVKLLIDHFALEVRYRNVLEMLHRYDEEPQI